MKTKRRWCQLAVSVVAAGPAGGFLFGLLNAGDPDPNPIGRFVYACMMAAKTPLHGGFPPQDEGAASESFNLWPHIVVSCVVIFGWLVYRDWRTARKRNEPPA